MKDLLLKLQTQAHIFLAKNITVKTAAIAGFIAFVLGAIVF